MKNTLKARFGGSMEQEIGSSIQDNLFFSTREFTAQCCLTEGREKIQFAEGFARLSALHLVGMASSRPFHSNDAPPVRNI